MSRILNTDALTNHGHAAGRRTLVEILEAGLQAADPYYKTLQLVRREGDILRIGGELFEPPGSPRAGDAVIDLRQMDRIFVFGAGKGIQRVGKALEELLGDRLTGGHLIDKQGTPHILQRIGVTFGAHPVPDAACAAGCQRIIELAQGLTAADLVFTAVGNGVSALLTLPAESVSLEELQRITYSFQIERGGPTVDLIPIRNHLDRMKGGQFSRYLQPARMVHLLAFHRAPYATIMHSPYYRWLHPLPDDTTYADAIAALKKWDTWDVAPASVRAELSRTDRARATLPVAEFERMDARIFCLMPQELDMVPAVRRKAEELGFRPHVLYHNYTMLAEASQVGKVVASLALHSERDGDPFTPPCALISGGELLVTVGNERGMGGRNQEFALSAALDLADTAQVVMGAIDSDGTDGPGHQFVDGLEEVPVLAGAIVDGSTAARAAAAGLDLREALKRHNTSPALHALDDGVVAVPSMSMGDLSVTLILGRGEDQLIG